MDEDSYGPHSHAGKRTEDPEAYFRRAIERNPQSAKPLADYAGYDDGYFLNNFALLRTHIIVDHDQAEELYERAIEADPDEGAYVGNYANFLTDFRRDHARAHEFYRRAVEVDPDLPHNLGNYAGFLFAHGHADEGKAYLKRAFEKVEPEQHDLMCELLFYAIAHGHPGERDTSMATLLELLGAGVRSADWDFSDNINRVGMDEPERVEFLEKLAAVINDKQPLAALE